MQHQGVIIVASPPDHCLVFGRKVVKADMLLKALHVAEATHTISRLLGAVYACLVEV